MAGEAPIPHLVPTHNVTSYGARGDGVTDDTLAFTQALSEMEDGDVLGIPAGK
jgi:polygalacturonase